MVTKEIAKELYNNSGKLRVLKQYYKKEYEYIVNKTSFLTQKKIFLKQRLWHIANDIFENITCQMCSTVVKWDDTSKNQKYRKYCSHKCQHSDPNNVKKRLSTMRDRYGDKLEKVVKKTQKTNLERYGYENQGQIPENIEKRKKTNLERYGDEHPINNPDILEKRKKTNIEKYGHEHAAQSQICKDKTTETCIKKYGSFHQGHQLFSETTLACLKNKEYLINLNHHEKITIYEIANNLKTTIPVINKWFIYHDIEIKRWPSSIQEKELSDFLTEHDINFNTNNRSIIAPKELDFTFPEYNIALELDGIYWHAELSGNRDKNYHLEKTKKCEEQNIQLIHIFENEWVLKKEIIKSKILNICKKNTNKIYARKCAITEITSKEKSKFLNTVHIQQDAKSSINLGLLYENEIVACMTFSKSRYNKCEYEMIRYATILNTNVIGGANKLFQHFIKNWNPTSVVSFSNKRWGTGNMYKHLGFDYSHTSSPNYFYFKYTDIFNLQSRIQFQKHKLKDKLEIFDPKLTEWQNMVNNGYDRIWDCGNDVFIWNSTNHEKR